MVNDVNSTQIRITEIFHSLQGETSRIGLPTVFVRLTGCPLRCLYCDTAYAFTGGQRVDIESILLQVAKFQTQQVCVTGGEPLAQAGCLELLRVLCDAGYQVSLETSGAMDIQHVDARVAKVLDIKTPASDEESRNLLGNLDYLTANDEIKFVICDRADYEWSKQQIMERNLFSICPVLFSPSANQVSATELAEWILEDNLQVRFQLQLHKILWGDRQGV